MFEVIDLSPKQFGHHVTTRFKKIRELRGLRTDEVISYYFHMMSGELPNKQAYLRQL